MKAPGLRGETARLRVNGADLLADLSGALVWPDKRTLVVADLHLEKGSSLGRHKRPLPPYDSAATLGRLETVIARYEPETVICLGDSFHDGDGATRLSDGDRGRLRALTNAREWVWIAGNHDPAPSPKIGGQVAEELVIGGLLFRHVAADGRAPAGEISGHYHPKAAVWARGRRMSHRCFAGDGRRLVLPAFGAYTGGLSVLDPAIRALFPRRCEVHLLGRQRIVSADRSALVA
ncbi:ligase-associated DNA damage response endonuclease PdeM [Ferruginivarius sediminum]|uniref:Ligase-associated DNA damage response endonuclease PdeM n=2 Tax=Ferruginivarius sediminum TaxID=2661937 RepID=A0A369TAT9_9PROT|nr:ligase-associated DNA damage response endonuclease PdeM [Ferruginivarius sediminum]